MFYLYVNSENYDTSVCQTATIWYTWESAGYGRFFCVPLAQPMRKCRSMGSWRCSIKIAWRIQTRTFRRLWIAAVYARCWLRSGRISTHLQTISKHLTISIDKHQTYSISTCLEFKDVKDIIFVYLLHFSSCVFVCFCSVYWLVLAPSCPYFFNLIHVGLANGISWLNDPCIYPEFSSVPVIKDLIIIKMILAYVK